MVGRDLRDVAEWSIIPPAASLTLNWGAGGCTLEFGGGSLQMKTGDWMWIDAGLAHRGQNVPGSDFLTVFIPESYVIDAALHVAPIGAASQRAPSGLAKMLIGMAALLVDGASTRAMEAPFLDAILDWVGTTFDPRRAVDPHGDPILLAAQMLRDDQWDAISIGHVADTVGLSRSALSRRFKGYHRVTPEVYRQQVRLSRATIALAMGSSVLAAAHDAGFADTAHLSRTFRKQYGIAPSLWAKQVAGSAASYPSGQGRG